jgi:hypothetical protein
MITLDAGSRDITVAQMRRALAKLFAGTKIDSANIDSPDLDARTMVASCATRTPCSMLRDVPQSRRSRSAVSPASRWRASSAPRSSGG